ncbi:hypothetical protein DH2020_022983 [Rehmannia glutinosa]|uniref:NADP-dependent oxidoreductase domain-containing protein n=1 Tax=Rehmannia glutinosa TaxID=99300 RepID=A0ABR0W936_REHGL
MAAEKQINVPKMKLGSQGLQVSSLGLGCMGMSAFFGPPKPEPEMIEVIHHAINSGVTFLDTADIYGPYTNEILIGKACNLWPFNNFALRGGMREKVELATKCGFKYENGSFNIVGDPAYIRAACEASLKRLDVDYIDLYYLHRIDINVPIEIAEAHAFSVKNSTFAQWLFRIKVGELKKLVDEGKIKYIGLSEASASTIRRAHAVHPITAVQLEELGIGIVVYSPLGRGFFSSGAKVVENASEDDFRKSLPRFQPENLEHNNSLFERVKDMATRKDCTPSQLALAWIYHQGNDVCPIPGTTKINNLNQNIGALAVKLTSQEMAELDSIASSVIGDRYQNLTDTWMHMETPPLSSWKVE